MGDRNNIKITYSNGQSLFLYSHWGGSDLHNIVVNALETSGRVTDESYFARVLFSRMVTSGGTGDIDSDTGYGIAPYVVDQDVSNKMIHIDYSTGCEQPQIDYEHEEEL
jgi:hypothetical protein